MRNERGVTLIEIIVALAISTILIGVAFLMFSQIYFLWNDTTTSVNDASELAFLQDVISREMAAPTKIYLVGPSELRFQPFEDQGKRRALVFDSDLNSISLYDISSLTGSNPIKSNEFQVSDRVIAFEVKNLDNSQIVSDPEIPVPINHTFKLSITILSKDTKADGFHEAMTKTVDIAISPFFE